MHRDDFEALAEGYYRRLDVILPEITMRLRRSCTPTRPSPPRHDTAIWKRSVTHSIIGYWTECSAGVEKCTPCDQKACLGICLGNPASKANSRFRWANRRYWSDGRRCSENIGRRADTGAYRRFVTHFDAADGTLTLRLRIGLRYHGCNR